MLIQRILTSTLLIALLLFVLMSEQPAVWPAFLAVFASFAAEEWAAFRWGSSKIGFFYALLTGLMAIFLVQPGVFPNVLLPLCGLALVFWVGICPIWLRRGWGLPSPKLHGLLGWLVILPTLVALHALRSAGITFVLSILVVVWVSDISAYFVGRAFGRHRLAPVISPGKTWEGVGGALVGVFVLAGFAVLLLPTSRPVHALVQTFGWIGVPFLMGIVLLGIEGDLFESWLKRCAGIKDSGWILPGHGGVLDRIDALTPTLPIVVLCLKWSPGMGGLG